MRSFKYHSKVTRLLLNCLCFLFILVGEYKPSNVCCRKLPKLVFLQSIFVQKSFMVAMCHVVMSNYITPLMQPIHKMVIFSD